MKFIYQTYCKSFVTIIGMARELMVDRQTHRHTSDIYNIRYLVKYGKTENITLSSLQEI